jgi:hypothetical protein
VQADRRRRGVGFHRRPSLRKLDFILKGVHKPNPAQLIPCLGLSEKPVPKGKNSGESSRAFAAAAYILLADFKEKL